MSVHTGIQAAHRTDSHGHCPQNRLSCAKQQAEPLPPSASSQGERAPGQGRQTTHRRRLSPHTGNTGFKECYFGTSSHDDRGTGAPLLAAEARHRRAKTRHGPGTIRRHPIPAQRKQLRTALPAKPARQRPAGRAGDPDRPAMYPEVTWHPPPVDLRRHRASPSDHKAGSPFNRSSAGQGHATSNRTNGHFGAMTSANVGYLPPAGPLRWRAQRTVIPAQVTTMIAAPGAAAASPEARHDEVKNPRHGPGTVRRHPIPAHRKRMADRITRQASTTATCGPS